MEATQKEALDKRIIDVKNAYWAAVNYLQALVPSSRSYTLEEVDRSEDENYWLITIGYQITEFDEPKVKVFKINSVTGNVESMKIRSLE